MQELSLKIKNWKLTLGRLIIIMNKYNSEFELKYMYTIL